MKNEGSLMRNGFLQPSPEKGSMFISHSTLLRSRTVEECVVLWCVALGLAIRFGFRPHLHTYAFSYLFVFLYLESSSMAGRPCAGYMFSQQFTSKQIL